MAIDTEAIIQAAIQRGVLDDLPGAGKPLPLHDDRCVPAEHRMGLRVMKNAGILPPQVEGRRRLAAMRAELAGLTEPAARRALMTEISAVESVVNLGLERFARGAD